MPHRAMPRRAKHQAVAGMIGMIAIIGTLGSLACAGNVAPSEPLWPAVPLEPVVTEVLDEAAREDELAGVLDRHPGYWRCAGWGARMSRTSVYRKTVSVTITMVNDESGDAAVLVVDPMPGEAILRACLVEALASDTFAPTPAPIQVVQRLEFDPRGQERIAAKIAELGPEAIATADAKNNLWPGDRTEGFEFVTFDVIMNNAVYVVDASAREVMTANLPDPLDVTVHFCVEPATGKISRIWRHGPGSIPAEIYLMSVVAKWRFRPIEVDGKPVHACSHVDFSIIRARPAASVEAEFGSVIPPLEFIPPVAIHTPVPHWTVFRRWVLRDRGIERMRRSRWRRKLEWSGRNTTAFCVDVNGRVTDVRTRERFPDGPEVDEILRDAVKTWRYKPVLIDGQPREICTERRFVIVFEIPP